MPCLIHRKRPLGARIASGFVAATLAIGLVPVAAFATNEPTGESAIDAFAANLNERFAAVEQTGNVDLFANVSEAYDFENGDGASLLSADLPAKFDLRDQGVVTPVKLQNPWASCWGFAAIAASETSILSELGTTYEETPIDLSEHHTAWFAYTALPEDTTMYSSQAGEGYYAYDETQSTTMNFGSTLAATSVFSSGIGPVTEQLVPYHGINPETGEPTIGHDSEGNPMWYSPNDDWSVDESLRFGTTIELEESNQLPSPSGLTSSGAYESGAYEYNENATTAIKNELASGRAVSIAFYADSSVPGQVVDPDHHYIDTENWAHYTDEQMSPNHAVTIVGWDDDYPKENFVDGHEPPEDGAWIVKNSWGSLDQTFPNHYNWGIDGSGYFYLSYYDQTLSSPESFNYDTEHLGDSSSYFIIDQYDLLPSYGATSVSSADETRMANVFETDEDGQTLRALSCETSMPGTTVSYEVYLLNEGATEPTDGTLIATEQETYEYGGYHRVNLAEPLAIAPNSSFSVVVTERTPSGNYQLIADAYINKTGADYLATVLPSMSGIRYAVGVVNEGESYLYSEGTWQDWSNSKSIIAGALGDGSTPAEYVDVDNFPIKAYSDPAPIDFPDVSEGDWFYDAVEYVYQAGIMDGYEGGEFDGHFGPTDPMTREDMAVMLYKYLAPEEYAKTSDPAVYSTIADSTGMDDALDGQYYTPALNWAFENNILTGYIDGPEAGNFGVGDTISREQIATILYRALKNQTGEADPAILGNFDDGESVSAFATDAMAWCVENGLVQGAGTELQPQREANRAEIATIMMRADQAIL